MMFGHQRTPHELPEERKHLSLAHARVARVSHFWFLHNILYLLKY